MPRQTANRTHCKAGRLSPSSWPSPVGVARPPKKGPKALWGRATPTGEGQDGGLRPRALARAWRPSEANRGQSRPTFTDADTFGVECQDFVPTELRKMLLVATFLIDFTCFENNNNGGGLNILGD
jgi:hypothetical protein